MLITGVSDGGGMGMGLPFIEKDAATARICVFPNPSLKDLAHGYNIALHCACHTEVEKTC
jgi:hypothetical protein